MTASEPGPLRSRLRSAGAVVLALVAVALGVFGVGEAEVGPSIVRGSVARQLDELGTLAAVTDERGELAVPRRLPVEVVQEGGPAWVRPGVVEAVESSSGFALAERVGDDATLGGAVLRCETMIVDSAIAVRLRLHRKGWDLAGERPIVVHRAVWLPIAVLLATLAARWFTRWPAGVLGLAAGLVAQVGVTWLPWPDALPATELAERWKDGPLGWTIVTFATRSSDRVVAFGAGIIALCVVLIAFDHRRSPARGGTLMLSSVGVLVGGLAFVEAAWRCSVGGWLLQPIAWLAVLGLIALTGAAIEPRSPGKGVE